MNLMILPLMPKNSHLPAGPMAWNSSHPVSSIVLEHFAEGLASPEERRLVLAHLLTGCRECCRALGRQWQGVPTDESDYEDAIDRSAERALAAFAIRTH